MRKIIVALLFCAMSLLVPQLSSAAAKPAGDAVNLMIEGKTVVPEVPPLLVQGRTMVPVRIIAESLGADVQWDPSTETATIERQNSRLQLRLNSTKATLNGKAVQLETPPMIHNQRMLLPLRFVGEALGCNVGWDNDSRTVLANPSIGIQVNDEKVTFEPKLYQIGDSWYAPIGQLAELVGWSKTFDQSVVPEAKTIDSQVMVPLDEAEDLLDAKLTWQTQDNLLVIERLSKFTGFEVDGQTVNLQLSKQVSAKHFVLTQPDRLVLDLPQTVLSSEMKRDVEQPEEEAATELQADGALEADDADVDATDVDEEDTTATDDQEANEKQTDAEPLVTKVRYSQYSSSPQTVRVVIELREKSDYTLKETADGLQISFAPAPHKTGFLIVVDAGHGGHDQGASGVAGNVEKDYNLQVANRVVELLKQYKEFQVVATRSTDVYLTLDQRVQIANKQNADLFLSVHANSFPPSPSARGTETYYYNANSKTFAEIVHRHLLAATKFPDRGVKKSAFYVIKNTKMPAVLTETGFLSNAYENSQLTSPAFREKIAQGLVAAIREYYTTYY
ncbi:N-acetylmuramoyl-L-alanine amidase family protein [Brevibacillus fulvus]|uniref:N-acetylmuramoyl-L-alanine amidase n=1 Tax=Brevibacillus fulvus TaxID=1125967 RepID=A0A939BVM3_9BACL|nr:N-acetylmuramoyl-L-alanine amidase family protein [Brevibacillus fulvus]MBM7591604.1 N-acetylmuramoyl-L-alanine amidase [Brevibacillus fulvus]